MPDESAYGGRDPVSSKLLFFLDSGHPPPADSGMTDLLVRYFLFSVHRWRLDRDFAAYSHYLPWCG